MKDQLIDVKRVTYTGNPYFSEIQEVYPIPTNSIIHKFVCGLGATHSEILAPRNSIIVFPNISIIKGKHESLSQDSAADHNTFPVYGTISVNKIYNYLVKDNKRKKLLTTPYGLKKIMRALSRISAVYKDDYFLLVDECHKLVKDASYRKDMTEMMDSFFAFKNKALVSATPLLPSDPRFKNEKFELIEVVPDKRPLTPIRLIDTNNVTSALQNYIAANPLDMYLIFFNTVSGILNIIDELKLTDYKIFCSGESMDLLKLTGQTNTSDYFNEPAKFNFFTSSFNAGLDIILPNHTNPDIIMISDCGYRKHAIIDPFTDTKQIIGRVRDVIIDDERTKSYRNIIHINNTSKCVNVVDEDEEQKSFQDSRGAYELMSTLKTAFIDQGYLSFFEDAISRMRPYYNMLNDEKFSHYLYDYHLNENRVRRYYSHSTNLKNAYLDTNSFLLIPESVRIPKEDIAKLKNIEIRYTKENIVNILDQVIELENIMGTDIYNNAIHQIQQRFPYVLEAYDRMGYKSIQGLHFDIKKIKKRIKEMDIEEGLNQLPVIDKIYDKVWLNQPYLSKDIKPLLQKIFDEFQINYTAKATDIEKYFKFKKFDKLKGKSARGYILIEYVYNRYRSTDTHF
ncbi:DEAD/DEAH box helicase family protein [Mucilaginibacter sp. JRF]|uniref:DEAD/DEAH box helicase family protein n=1 Tax=Mucilaginibacter sp. JRF TaxID=2780088 RepID=UPI001880C58B|nr:DEAD/DEAH box helicase family protein [Mucilaginibacter sp. JRF]MBE9584013.1 DEAD/DEAH box helicase family protein [Mucilaginibacter sp. JRF]